jgi:hypothetical protein
MYQPISTMFNTLTSSATVLSPLTPLTITQTPISTVTQSVIVNNDPLTIVTPIGPQLYFNRPGYVMDIDTGVNDSYIVQRDVTKYLRYKTLDKWIYTEFPNVLKYLVVDKDNVRIVKNESEHDNNKVSSNSTRELEAKSDYIADNILTESAMREVLIRIMRELGVKWYDLPYHEDLVMDVVEKYIEKKLKKMLN